jgi:pimeloyl-ACP methyl ester carboxylesterase
MLSSISSAARTIAAVFLLAYAMGTHAADRVGVVLLHGKRGSPDHLASLANDLAQHGYLVAVPDMPWSKSRAYDRTLEDGYREIDAALDGLRQRGAVRLVVGGHSMGANMAIGYTATHKNVDAVMALGPGQTVESQSFIDKLGSSVSRARSLLAEGKGNEKLDFQDLHLGKLSAVAVSPKVYLSYFDPEGYANMPKMAQRIVVPFLWTVGNQDANMLNRGSAYAFERAKPNTLSRYVTVDADHMGTPEASREEAVRWLGAVFSEAARVR